MGGEGGEKEGRGRGEGRGGLEHLWTGRSPLQATIWVAGEKVQAPLPEWQAGRPGKIN